MAAWRPAYPGEVPTLGYDVLDWITEYLAAPDRPDYEPFVLYREQAEFVLNYYALDPRTGRRRYRRGLLSRPRGWGKSPLLAALAVAEALGPVVPDGWDAHGRPVGKPWWMVRTPLVQIAAVSEAQTKNTWSPLLEMLEGPVIDEYAGLEPLGTFVNLPRGRIEPVTSSARTIKGNRPVFAVLDQTEEWVKSNGGHDLATTIRVNAGKIGGTTVESPNAFTPGEDSVAERSAEYAAAILEGRTRDATLLYDHREAPPETDLEDRDSLIAGLRTAYGDSSNHPGGCVIHEPACPPGHSDIEVNLSTIWDPSNDVQQMRSDFLNQITHASDSWITSPSWAGCADPLRVVADRDPIVLGFDGSRKRSRGVTDATALIGCRVSDGYLFEIGVWEQPSGAAGKDWEVPREEVDAAVRSAFKRYAVVGFYADPAKWETYVAGWEAAFGGRLKVKSTRAHPVEWWMTGGRSGLVARALEQFENAVLEGEVAHDGSYALTRHVLNARRRYRNGHLRIEKEFPDSPRKIDAAVAAVLAWQARLDAVAAGIGKARPAAIPRRIR